MLGAAGVGWLLRSNADSNAVSRQPSYLALELQPADALGVTSPSRTNTEVAPLTRTAFTLSPDGRDIVFAGRQGEQQLLFRRSLAEGEAQPIAGVERAVNPVFSPDGEWIAFWSEGQLKKISFAGGPAVPIFDVEEPTFGLSWTSDESIVFARRRGGLWIVSSNGGDPTMLTGHDLKGPLVSHRLPWMLPKGDVVLYTEVVDHRFEQAKIIAQSLSGGNSKLLVAGATHPIYTATGHLLYAKLGVLWAVPFDADTLELAGDPVPVVGNIVQSVRTGSSYDNTGAAQISVSASGTLAYLPGALLRTEVRHLVWADRQGNTKRLPFDRGLFWYPRVSPDGRRVAVNDEGKILILDLARGVTQRLPGAGQNVGGWSPDGSRVVFNVIGDTARNLFWQLADGSEPSERLTESPQQQFGGPVLPDGSALIFVSGANLLRLDLEQPGHEPTSLLAEAFEERYPAPSPDGRWLAYASNESGDWEVYVRAYPRLDGKQQISRDGGSMPAWSPDGRELFYMTPKAVDREYAIMAVNVSLTPSFRASTPRELFRGRFLYADQLRTYDVHPDGRFLMIEDDEERPTHGSLRIVLNWFDELERLVPRNE